MSSTASAVLQAWIYGNLASHDELADAGEVSRDVFQKFRSGDREIPLAVAARISRYMMARRGRTELAHLMCDAAHMVQPVGGDAPDGRVTDEVVASVGHLGDLARHYDADDLDAADRAADALMREATAAKREIALRRGQTAA